MTVANMKRILHVTDCMTSGTSQAIISIAKEFEDYRHSLLFDYRDDAPLPDFSLLKEVFDEVSRWQRGRFRRWSNLLSEFERARPDAIYLHSSFAGFYGRLLPKKVKLLYSSHGFAFQRTDIGRMHRLFFELIERVLSKRNQVYVAQGPLDYEIARNVLRMREVTFLKLHVTKQAPRLAISTSHEVDNNLFLIVGRIAPAKGPEFACAVARELSNLDKECEIVWMGGVDKHSEQIIKDFTSAGIKIKEWSSNSDVLKLMAKVCSVLITSSWESNPLVLFESLGQKTPIIARTIPAISIYGFETFANPLEFAQEMVRMKLSLKHRKQVLVEQSEKVATVLGRYPTNKLTLS